MRGFIIGTLQVMTYVYFFVVIAAFAFSAAYMGYRFDFGMFLLGGIVGFVIASVICGLIFVLIEIRDLLKAQLAQGRPSQH